MTISKIPLIYILSSGRSGSTLLDLLLGAHPEIWTLGEAQMLPWELRENRAPCGCGQSLEECDFWQSVLARIPVGEGNYPIEHFREGHGKMKVLRWELLGNVVRGCVSRRWEPAAQEYGRLNAEYFQTVWDAVQARTGSGDESQPIRWLVDASKDVYRLLWLQASDLFDLRVIHILKDPRSYVYSMIRHQFPNSKRKMMRFTGRWIVENRLFRRLRRNGFPKGNTCLVRYEDLARAPQETLERIGHWLGLEVASDLSEHFREVENHAISGNQMRWENTSIQLDEKWRKGLVPGHAWAVWATTWPVRRTFGY